MDAKELSRKTAIVEKALKAIKNKLVVDVVLESINGNLGYDRTAIEVKIKYKSDNNPNGLSIEYAFDESGFSQELGINSLWRSVWGSVQGKNIEKLVPSKKLSHLNDTQLATLRIAAFYYIAFAKRDLVNPYK